MWGDVVVDSVEVGELAAMVVCVEDVDGVVRAAEADGPERIAVVAGADVALAHAAVARVSEATRVPRRRMLGEWIMLSRMRPRPGRGVYLEQLVGHPKVVASRHLRLMCTAGVFVTLVP